MKRSIGLAVLGAFLFTIVGAYGQDVHYNYDRGVNFGAYKTYKWVDIPGGSVPDQLIDGDIRRSVDEQLAAKGLTKVDQGADLYVGYQALVSLERRVDAWGSSDSLGGGWGGPWGGGWRTGSAQAETSTVPVGILVIDVYDPAKRQLIWRGDATKTIDLKKDPDKNYKNLQKAMTKLFKNFPPQPK